MNPEAPDPRISGAYAALAHPTDPAEEPVDAVRRRMRQRARRRRGVGAVLAGCVVAVLAVGTVQLVDTPAERPSANAGGGAAAPTPAPTGVLPDAGTASCAYAYDRTTLRQRDWAADATVTSIGPGHGTVSVRLDVHTWYRGGSGDHLRVRLPSPRSGVEDEPPSYAVGTRLLLSGARSGGGYTGWSCGFTRYFDEDTAAVWAQVFSR